VELANLYRKRAFMNVNLHYIDGCVVTNAIEWIA